MRNLRPTFLGVCADDSHPNFFTGHYCFSIFTFDKPETAAAPRGFMGAAITVGGVYAHLVRDLEVEP